MKRKIVLSESKFRGLVKNIITEILVKKAYSKFYSDIPEDEYNKIADADKTRGNHLGSYAKWLLELYKKNKFDLNNLDKAKKYISVFDRMAQAGQLKGVDINTFDSIDDMYELVKDNLDSDVITKGDKIRKVKETGVERIYEDGEWLVVSPKTHEASCRYGANTKWCTTEKDDDSQFKDYISDGPLYTLINKKTNDKYQLHFERKEYRDAKNRRIKLSSLNLPDNIINVITKGDKMKILRFKYDHISRFNEGIAKVETMKGYNFVDQNYKIMSKQWFDSIGNFKDGLARVKLNGKWNFINMDGKLLTNQWFTWAGEFKNGLAKVNVSGKGRNFINQDGEMLSKQYFNRVGDFESDFAMVKINSKGFNFINENGEILSNQWFDWVGDFESDFAMVKINSKGFNFINENGDVLSNQWFDDIYSFKDGFARVGINYKFNLIDENGKLLTNQWFDYIDYFKGGFVRVRLGNKWNFIDQNAEILSPNMWFVDVGNFRNGVARVYTKEGFNFINRNGKLLSPNKWFDEIIVSTNDFTTVKIQNETYKLDFNNGSIVKIN